MKKEVQGLRVWGPPKLRGEQHRERAAPWSQGGGREEAKGPVWPPPGRGRGVNTCPRGPGRPFVFDLEELFGITKWITHTRLLLRAAYTQESRGRGGGLTQQLHGALGSCHTSPVALMGSKSSGPF